MTDVPINNFEQIFILFFSFTNFDNPATDNPAFDNPAIGNPAIDNPAFDNPAIDNLAIDNPAIDNPAARCQPQTEVQSNWITLLTDLNQSCSIGLPP